MKTLILTFIILFFQSFPLLAKERIALVIGNSDYLVKPLETPVNDAQDVATILKQLGFDVILETNINRQETILSIKKFANKLHKNAVGLFYFSGHGMQYAGNNYLIPMREMAKIINISGMQSISFVDRLEYLEKKAINVDKDILSIMKSEDNGLNILILDACRDILVAATKSLNQIKGLASMRKITSDIDGTLIAYATAAGRTARDGGVGERNSPYTKHLLRFMKQSNLTIESMLKRVRNAVIQETHFEQKPWYEASISEDFYFFEGKIDANIIRLPRETPYNTDNRPIYNTDNKTDFPLPTHVWRTIKSHSNSSTHHKGITDLAFSPDGKTLASGSYDTTMKLFDINSGKLIFTFEGHSSHVWSVAYSPDGKKALSGSMEIKLWDLTTGKLIRTMGGYGGSTTSLHFLPDGKKALSGQADMIKLWDLDVGQIHTMFDMHSDYIRAVVLSPDGRRVISASQDKTVKLWDLSKAWKPTRTIEWYDRWTTAASFSFNGKKALLGDSNSTVVLWDLPTGNIQYLKGHSATINTVSFSPVGNFAASGSSDNTIKLWNVDTGKLEQTLHGHDKSMNMIGAVCFSSKGILATGDHKGIVKLWK
ncbi:MAG: caspase family protein [Thiotrichaceae bacterium]|nr:caspase family protein [Thiotrichaceae bacterium]